MPLILSLVLLAQVGPFAGAPDKSMQVPAELRAREGSPKQTETVQAGPPVSAKLADCLATVRADPQKAARAAQGWLEDAKGGDRADAAHCLGMALSRLDRLGEAHAALIKGRDAAPADDFPRRARLGAMAGNAALAEGEAQVALAALDTARDDALTARDETLVGDLGIDRARALVMLERDGEAVAALAEARRLAPLNMHSWLFSAALARRQGALAEAQAHIEQAAELRPADPEVGLEAGRIAMVAGRVDAARKSWQSVIDAAPDSDAAATARRYLAQLASDNGGAP